VKPFSSYESGLDETFSVKIEMDTLWLERVVIVEMKALRRNGVTVGGLANERSVEKAIVGEGGTIEQ
jgi:hypothetical protein